MTRPAFALPASAVIAAAIACLSAGPAAAQANRTFVSGQGSDSNPCSLGAPCRSFQQAHNTVLPGGEIVALDAAGYGPLAITKAVTVTAIGIEASITSNSASAALAINAGANDVVAIRGLTLLAGATSGNGIEINSAKSVTIRDCSLGGFTAHGIFVDPGGNLNVELRDLASSNNGFQGIHVVPSGTGMVTVLITDSSFTGNSQGGLLIDGQGSTGTLDATLNVTAAANIGTGLFVISVTGKAQPVVMVTGAKLVNNTGAGLIGSGPVQVFVDRTQITGNSANGWEADNSAAVKSYKNNEVNGNASDALNGVVQITGE